MDSNYFPIFRSRQEENKVLTSFPFGSMMTPIIEVIREKDRITNRKSCHEIYSEIIEQVKSRFVFLDLPIYLTLTTGTKKEVIKFFRGTISVLQKRIDFFESFKAKAEKIIPVVSTLFLETGESNTIMKQYNVLKKQFPSVAIRIFFKNFDQQVKEIKNIKLRTTDIIIYDLDSIPLTHPQNKKNCDTIHMNFSEQFLVMVRNVIEDGLQNIDLIHGEIIGEADNSLMELYKNQYSFSGFGDYVGIKKDKISEGGSISPGFIIYDPIENVYYGYKGRLRKLSEFETRIVPDVLKSKFIKRIENNKPEYLEYNQGYRTLLSINNKKEKGQLQAKFKRISMEHYLRCMQVKIEDGEI